MNNNTNNVGASNSIVRPLNPRPRKDTKNDHARLTEVIGKGHGSVLEAVAAGDLNYEVLKKYEDAILQVARALGHTLDDRRQYPWETVENAAKVFRQVVPDLRTFVDVVAEVLQGIKENGVKVANWKAAVGFVAYTWEALVDSGDAHALRAVDCYNEFNNAIWKYRGGHSGFDDVVLYYLRGLMAHAEGDPLGAAAHYLLAASEMEPDYSVFGTGVRTRAYLRDRALEYAQAADVSVF